MLKIVVRWENDFKVEKRRKTKLRCTDDPLILSEEKWLKYCAY